MSQSPKLFLTRREEKKKSSDLQQKSRYLVIDARLRRVHLQARARTKAETVDAEPSDIACFLYTSFMSWYHPTSLLDKVFEGGIIIKGLTGVAEFAGGLLLFFVSPATIHNFVVFITQDELLEDPHDRIANLLLSSSQYLTSGNRTFLIIYLWIHAFIKFIAVIGILKNQRWAYPFSLITLGALMLYQLYSIIFVAPQLGLVLLTIFDVFILALIWREYGKIRAQDKPKANS